MTSTWGIDISNHQAGADLARAKAAGCSFVFVKASEGGTYRDAHFAGFHTQAQAVGLPIGVYHFARPGAGRSGAQEARFFLSVVGSRLGNLPPVLDLEDTKLGSAATVAWALDFLRTVEKATGVRPIVYTYTSFAQAHLSNGKGLEAYPLWLANYRASTAAVPAAPKPWSSWHIWQHSSTSRVPGIPGDCDRNISNLTSAQLRALTTKASTGAAPASKEWDDMATKDDLKAAVREVLMEDGLVPSPFIKSNTSVAPVTALSYAMQWALQARDRTTSPAALAAAVASAAASLGSGAVTDEQLERVLRGVLGSLDN